MTVRNDQTLKGTVVKMICNYHTHTYRCGHAKGEEREYIEKAIAEGLEVMGFSDHVPMAFPSGFRSHYRCPVELLGEYMETLTALREEYKDRIKILIGFEAEYYPAHFESMMAMLGEYGYDYLILGQHFVGNEEGEKYSGAPTDSDETLKKYVDQVITGAKTGAFTYVAHPDPINYTGDAETYSRQMKRLCTEMKALDIPLEFNLLGFEESRNYPCERFWKIVAEVGNRVILGCDAHRPERVADQEIISSAVVELAKYGITPTKRVEIKDPKKYRTV